MLRFQEGLTFAQLGECLGIAEPTAFDRVKRAVATLRERLAQFGHAAVLTELESWLGRGEAIAVPTGLAGSLIALAAGGGTAATAGKPLLAIVVSMVALFGGGAALIIALQPEPALPSTAIASPPSEATLPAAARSELPRELDGSASSPASATAPAAGGRPAREFLSTWLGAGLSDGDGPLSDRLVATGRITGHVVDDDGRSVARAAVTAASSDGAGKGYA
ncbi:MAG: sigma-70 family RNA polymerase sigma factor [Planctomycetes bacterium]|nr:sigma-70 family RNA polymerase sigma factor [Planctomycetota bacterium]